MYIYKNWNSSIAGGSILLTTTWVNSFALSSKAENALALIIPHLGIYTRETIIRIVQTHARINKLSHMYIKEAHNNINNRKT